MDPNVEEAVDQLISQANALVNQGRYDRAIAGYTEAIRLAPGCASAHMGRGVVYAKLGRYREAIAGYTEAIRLNPALVAAYRNRGRDYSTTGQHQLAIDDFTEAIRLEPGNAAAYSDRGYAYGQLGDFDRAIADCAEAIRLDPNLDAARANLFQAKAHLARCKQHKKWWQVWWQDPPPAAAGQPGRRETSPGAADAAPLVPTGTSEAVTVEGSIVKSTDPKDLPRLFCEGLDVGDVDAVVALYEPDAVVAPDPEQPIRGEAAIRTMLAGFLAQQPRFALHDMEAIVAGNLALIRSRWTIALPGATSEMEIRSTLVARRHPEGHWLVVIDRPLAGE